MLTKIADLDGSRDYSRQLSKIAAWYIPVYVAIQTAVLGLQERAPW